MENQEKKVRYINIPADDYDTALRVLKDGFNISPDEILNYEKKEFPNGGFNNRFTVEDTRV